MTAVLLVHAAATLALLFARPDGVSALQVWIGAALLAVVWLSTALG